MENPQIIQFKRDQFFNPEVDKALEHQKALFNLVDPKPTPEPVSPAREFFLSELFYRPFSAMLGALIAWIIIEPIFNDTVEMSAGQFLFFPVVATLIIFFFFLGEGIVTRRLGSTIPLAFKRGGLGFLFILLSFVPSGFLVLVYEFIAQPEDNFTTIKDISAGQFLAWIPTRSWAWALCGLAIGFSIYMNRGTTVQIRNSVMGGVVGGALGGLFFDPVDRFIFGGLEEADVPRLIGVLAVGCCIGIFIALGEHLSRDGWFRVRTGPLAGKSFILYKNSTHIGSSPRSDIYLFKDANIAATHASVHRVGPVYEVENHDDKIGIQINQQALRGQQRLVSGDQIQLGDTILEFEERAKQSLTSKLSEETHV